MPHCNTVIASALALALTTPALADDRASDRMLCNAIALRLENTLPAFSPAQARKAVATFVATCGGDVEFQTLKELNQLAQSARGSLRATAPASGHDSVPLFFDGSRAQVSVTLGASFPATMLIDTGASQASVNFWVANLLLSKGEATPGAPAEVTLAGGQTTTMNTIVIGRLTIGNHSAVNVRATINPEDDADMLLPFPILNQMGRFTIDTANRQLVFGS
jgi:hypothetical protein